MEQVLNSSQQRVVDVAAKQKRQNASAKAKGYNSHKDLMTARKWKAVRFISCVAVVGYVFFDHVVKWF